MKLIDNTVYKPSPFMGDKPMTRHASEWYRYTHNDHIFDARWVGDVLYGPCHFELGVKLPCNTWLDWARCEDYVPGHTDLKQWTINEIKQFIAEEM